MCLLQLYHEQQENNTNNLLNMSLMSACTCPLNISKHSDLISKTEFEADMKSKYSKPRNCSWNVKNQKKNRKKMDERTPKGRRHGHNQENGDTDHQNGLENKKDSSRNNSPTASPAEAINGEDYRVNGTDTVDNIIWSDRLPQLSDLPTSSSSSSSTPTSPNSKVVHFDEDHLTEVIEFPDDEDSKNVRKIYWEFFHVDRMRFRDRICQLQTVLDGILQSNHREQIYSQRFQEPTLSSSESSSSCTPTTATLSSTCHSPTELDCKF